MIHFNTLQVKRPIGYVFALTLIALLVLLALLEMVARTPQVRELLTIPNMGTRHYQFGHKLRLLEDQDRLGEGIDCIALGSSIVDNGFDPVAFSRAFRAQSGDDISCFNFAIDAMPASGAAALAKILVQEYRPKVLIYGTSARDLVIARQEEDATVILDSPWVRYRLGYFNIEGLLLNYSHLYRYWKPLQQLAQLNFENALRAKSRTLRSLVPLTSLGQTPLNEVAVGVDSPPDPTDDSFHVTNMTKTLANYYPQQENLQAVQQLVSLNGSGLHVFIVEMPVPDGYYFFLGSGQDDYQVFIDSIAYRASQNAVPFLRTETFKLIPDDGWADYAHVNQRGAIVLSEWLGYQMANTLSEAEDDQSILIERFVD